MTLWIECLDGSLVNADVYGAIILVDIPPAQAGGETGIATLRAVSVTQSPWIIANGPREDLERLKDAIRECLVGQFSLLQVATVCPELVAWRDAALEKAVTSRGRLPCPKCGSPVARFQTACFGCGVQLTEADNGSGPSTA